LHMVQLIPLPLTVSCFSKIQIGFTFLVPAHPGSPRQRAVKRVWCVCVCVCVCNSDNISSDALRPIFSTMLLKDFKKSRFVFFSENEHLNFVELSKSTPRCLADISHLLAVLPALLCCRCERYAGSSSCSDFRLYCILFDPRHSRLLQSVRSNRRLYIQ